jgi:hypothetical protein
MRRVRREHQDRRLDDPVTRADLAHLLDRFTDWPLPPELRDILPADCHAIDIYSRSPQFHALLCAKQDAA